MLAAHRHHEILRRIEAQGTVRTADLAGEFQVAEETIRRDLDRLHELGSIVRVHGGARSKDFGKPEIHREESGQRFLEEKKSIAAAALSLIGEGNTIFLDASSTALQLAHLLPGPHRNLSVVTPSLRIASVLASRPEIQLTLLGGRLDPASGSTVGLLATSNLSSLRIDRAFFSCRGVDTERGLSEDREDQAQLKRSLLAEAAQCVLLADHSKFGVCSNFVFADLARVHTLVTDSKTRGTVRKSFSRQVRQQVCGV